MAPGFPAATSIGGQSDSQSGPTPKMVYLDLPGDDVLAAVGRVALRSAQLEDTVKMTVKSITGKSPTEARTEMKKAKAWKVREKALQAAEQVFGPGAVVDRLKDRLTTCAILMDRRNGYLHALWGKELDGDHVIVKPSGRTRPHPTAAELNKLADDMKALQKEMTKERKDGGYLHEALAAQGLDQ